MCSSDCCPTSTVLSARHSGRSSRAALCGSALRRLVAGSGGGGGAAAPWGCECGVAWEGAGVQDGAGRTRGVTGMAGRAGRVGADWYWAGQHVFKVHMQWLKWAGRSVCPLWLALQRVRAGRGDMSVRLGRPPPRPPAPHAAVGISQNTPPHPPQRTDVPVLFTFAPPPCGSMRSVRGQRDMGSARCQRGVARSRCARLPSFLASIQVSSFACNSYS